MVDAYWDTIRELEKYRDKKIQDATRFYCSRVIAEHTDMLHRLEYQHEHYRYEMANGTVSQANVHKDILLRAYRSYSIFVDRLSKSVSERTATDINDYIDMVIDMKNYKVYPGNSPYTNAGAIKYVLGVELRKMQESSSQLYDPYSHFDMFNKYDAVDEDYYKNKPFVLPPPSALKPRVVPLRKK